MTRTDEFDIDDELAAHLRRTLHSLADTITEDDLCLASASPAKARAVPRSRRRRRIALASFAGAAALGLAAWNQLGDPGEIVRIPSEDALMTGFAEEGGEWWLIPSDSLHPGVPPAHCMAAVEFVGKAQNAPGMEWSTFGVVYGEVSDPGRSDACNDEQPWLANPARFEMGWSRMGSGDDPDSAWGYSAAFHPTVTEIRVAVDDRQAFTVDTEPLSDRPEGPRFAAFTVPPDSREVTMELFTSDGAEVLEWTRPTGG